MQSTSAKIIAGGIPGAMLGAVICENFEAINALLSAVIATFN